PTKDEIVADLSSTSIWGRGQNIVQELQNFNTTWNKQVFFGALGIPAIDGGTNTPWNYEGTANVGVQRNGFQAYREVFEELAWFGGFCTWFIGSDLEHSYRVIDKPSQYTIANWYEANPTTDTTAPANVTGSSKVSTDITATLSWVNPTATHFSL